MTFLISLGEGEERGQMIPVKLLELTRFSGHAIDGFDRCQSCWTTGLRSYLRHSSLLGARRDDPVTVDPTIWLGLDPVAMVPSAY